MKFNEIKIQDNFWCFEQNNVRCFLFIGQTFSLLIDACYEGNLRALCEEKTSLPLKLLLTHGDRDHIGCADQFDQVYLHPADFSYFERKKGQKPIATPLVDGDVFDIGTYRFEIVHIPGHTPGSIALLERQKRFLIGGDSIQTGPIYMFGEDRDMNAYCSSMDKLLNMASDFDLVYASHNKLVVNNEVISELRAFANDTCHHILPQPTPIPSPRLPSLPDDVKLYIKGNAQFYLQ